MALKKLENVRSDHAKRLEDLDREQTTDMQKAQLIEINLSLVIYVKCQCEMSEENVYNL